MREKLKKLLSQLNNGLIERETTVKLALLTLLAGENLVLIGPPGTGKSLIARRIAACFKSAENKENVYFEYLLTKFSTPEEIFGPLSISALKQDRFMRNTAGYLPSVRVAFLDEIFKASSSILNSLLTILNERIFHNGCNPELVPLQGLIAASNELPTGQEELGALYDRFLVRCFVDYVKEENIKMLFDVQSEVATLDHLITSDLATIKELAVAVIIPQFIREIIEQIWIEHRKLFKEDRREQLSDRRLRKVLNLLRVSAATNDRSEVNLSDIFLLKDCLWNHADNAAKVQEMIKDILGRNRYETSGNCIDNVGALFSESLPQHSINYNHAAKSSKFYDNVKNALVKEHDQLSDEITDRIEILFRTNHSKNSANKPINGYAGSGTENDPLLIKDINQLMGLLRPEVGLQGFYFKQTADIDASKLTHWDAISFKGHYNGSGYKITGSDTHKALFSSINPQSNVTMVALINIALAQTADKCTITQCETNKSLIDGTSKGCMITNCRSGLSLIKGDALNCTIKQCQAGSILIKCGLGGRDAASHCLISDCLIILDYRGGHGNERGGVVKLLDNKSYIERCFVTGKCSHSSGDNLNFSGLVYYCNNSEINNCAVGPLNFSSTSVKINNRIANHVVSSSLRNNAAIDGVPSAHSTSQPDGINGRSVAAAAFNQYFFEHTLNWDFDNIWIWSTQTDSPVLRHVGVNAVNLSSSLEKGKTKIDILAQQLNDNLWL